MLKTLGHTAVAAWICAALFASPILAAIECRQCCSSALQTNAKPVDQPAVPACCAQHQPAKPLGECAACPSCPKCEAKRPSPVVAGGQSPRQLPVPAVIHVAFLPSDMLAGLRTSWDGGRKNIDHATPPPRVLFCTWRE